MVERIVGLKANLQAASLSQSQALRKGDIPVIDARIGHHSPCRVSEMPEGWIDKTTRVEPLKPVFSASINIAASQSIGQLNTEPGTGVVRGRDRSIASRREFRNTAHTPTSENSIHGSL